MLAGPSRVTGLPMSCLGHCWCGNRIQLYVQCQDQKCCRVLHCPLSLHFLRSYQSAKTPFLSKEYSLSAPEEGSKMQKVLRIKHYSATHLCPLCSCVLQRRCQQKESRCCVLLLCSWAARGNDSTIGLVRGMSRVFGTSSDPSADPMQGWSCRALEVKAQH